MAKKGQNKGKENGMWKGGKASGKNRGKYVFYKNKFYRRIRIKRMEEIAGRKKPKRCELCELKGKICFDHDHKTGKFRGWICHNCNVIFGLVHENPKILLSMITYLKGSRIKNK